MLAAGAPLCDWLSWLETLSPKEINLGLERVEQILGRLDISLPEHLLLIAGTNGKGSSVAIADALLRASGLRVGAYTSPHIRYYNERIRVNGVLAADAEIVAAFESVEAVRGDTELTYFEYGTLAAAVVFAKSDLDVWILEVGLGGRLDATNALQPTASLITNVSLAQCDWLGSDVETIAVEKAGVMRPGKPTVFGDKAVPRSILRAARDRGAELILAGRDFDVQVDVDGRWTWAGPSRELTSLNAPGLIGDFQIGNTAAVLALLDAAGLGKAVDADLINRVLPGIALDGRSQCLDLEGVSWLIDVAHNPAAAQMLAETLESTEDCASTLAIFGLLDDKDLDGVVTPLSQHVDQWIAVTAESPRALPATEIARQVANLSGHSCLIAETVAEAMEIARRRASENDKILVTGSFFVVAPVLNELVSGS